MQIVFCSTKIGWLSRRLKVWTRLEYTTIDADWTG